MSKALCQVILERMLITHLWRQIVQGCMDTIIVGTRSAICRQCVERKTENLAFHRVFSNFICRERDSCFRKSDHQIVLCILQDDVKM